MSAIHYELCCAHIHSVELAARYNFEGIELCYDLASGGLTPSYGFIKTARSIFKNEIAVLVRPVKGNFEYNELHKKIILEEIHNLSTLDIDTLVIGALLENKVDEPFIQHCTKISNKKRICFHRAFDVISDKAEALNSLINLKLDRILTAGLNKPIEQNLELLKQLNALGSGQIELMAGGGIRVDNAWSIMETGIKRLHFSGIKKNSSDKNTENFILEIADEQVLKEMLNLRDKFILESRFYN